MGHGLQSENRGTYYPTSLMPELMGAHPAVYSSNNNSSCDSGARNASFFRNYRNDVLSRFSLPQTPLYEWEVQRSSYSPRCDLVAAANRLRYYDRSLTLPDSNTTTVDAQRMHVIDDFYKTAQLHREEYRDHRAGLLHPLKYSRAVEYSIENSPRLLSAYLFNYPETYADYKVPSVLPLTYERATKSPYLPRAARYTRNSRCCW